MRHFVILGAAIITLSACSSNNLKIAEFEPGSCVFSSGQKDAPDWMCAPDELFDQNYVYGIGAASDGYSDEYLQRKIAMTNARADIVSKMTTQIKESYTRDIQAQQSDGDVFITMATSLVTESNVDMYLPETRTKASVYDSEGNYHVLLEVKRSELLEAVRKVRVNIDRQVRQVLDQ